jgi:hypothetical protein
MTERGDVYDALLNAIREKVEHEGLSLSAQQLLWLSEAYAWVIQPSQPHGGGTNPPGK